MSLPLATNRANWLGHAVLAALLTACALGLAWAYVSSEHTVYFWDLGGYSGVSYDLAQAFRESPRAALAQVKNSIAQEYNYLYTLPLIPFQLVFGSSRLTYIAGVALVYLLPFLLVMGAIAASLAPPHLKPRAFWLGALSTFLVPMSWSSVLRGYPDIGGALFIALAVWGFLADAGPRRWRKAALAGALLAMAALFRRHFAYGAVAFFLAAGFQTTGLFIYRLARKQPRAWREWLISGLQLGLGGLVFAGVLAVFARPFLQQVLATNYAALYSSYTRPIGEVLGFFWSEFGPLLWGLAGLGYTAGLASGLAVPGRLGFVLLFGAISLLQWSLLVGQSGIHYPLHVVFLVALGLALLGLYLSAAWGGLKRTAAIGLLAAAIGFNCAASLTGLSLPSPLRSVLSLAYPPLVRSDYDEVVRLVNDLRALSPQGPIYVADSSSLMNYDILSKAEKELYRTDARLNIQVSPQIDSRDFLPLDLLMQASYVLVTTPFQRHLPADQQKVVRVVFDAFTQGWPIARDFERLPGSYALQGGAVLVVYRRVQPTSLKTALQTFDAIVSAVGRRPGGQLDWLALTGVPSMPLASSGGQAVKFYIGSSENAETAFLYYNPPPASGQVAGRASFDVSTGCREIQLSLAIADREGMVSIQKEAQLSPSQPDFSLTVPTHTIGQGYLVLLVQPAKTESAQPCWYWLNWWLKTP